MKDWDGSIFLPVNAVTGSHYNGINTLILSMDERAFETDDPRWCTYRQAQSKGWRIRQGERATTIFLTIPVEIEDETAEDGKRIRLSYRAFSVFHASQIDGIPLYAPLRPRWTKPKTVEIIMRNSRADVRTGGHRAFYLLKKDCIQLPPDHRFYSLQGWATTALHELGHWTGHPSRLDRHLSGRFGSAAYAMEELRAELASLFMGATIGLPVDIPNHASYVESWIEVLKKDRREIFRAARDAQRIADHCLSFHPRYAIRQKPRQ